MSAVSCSAPEGENYSAHDKAPPPTSNEVSSTVVQVLAGNSERGVPIIRPRPTAHSALTQRERQEKTPQRKARRGLLRNFASMQDLRSRRLSGARPKGKDRRSGFELFLFFVHFGVHVGGQSSLRSGENRKRHRTARR